MATEMYPQQLPVDSRMESQESDAAYVEPNNRPPREGDFNDSLLWFRRWFWWNSNGRPTTTELNKVTSLPIPLFDPGEIAKFEGQATVGRDNIRWFASIPENRVYDGIAGLVPGYLGIPGAYEVPEESLAAQGIAVFRYEVARKGKSPLETLFRPQLLHAKTIHEVRKEIANNLDIRRKAPDKRTLSLTKLLLVTHSMGGLPAILFAEHHPSLTDAVIHEAACGYGHPRPKEIIEDAREKGVPALWHDLIPTVRRRHIQPTRQNASDMWKYVRRPRVLSEGASCLYHDARPGTARIRESNIKVAYQAYEHDVLVRPSEDVAEHVDYYEVVPNAGHMAPMRRGPEIAHRIAAIIPLVKR